MEKIKVTAYPVKNWKIDLDAMKNKIAEELYISKMLDLREAEPNIKCIAGMFIDVNKVAYANLWERLVLFYLPNVIPDEVLNKLKP